MSGNSAVLEFSSSLQPPSHWLCPHCLPRCGWLLSWTLFSLCCSFCLFVSNFPPFSVFSPSASPPAPLVSVLHPPPGDNSPSVWGLEAGAQWFISEDCALCRERETHNKSLHFSLFSSVPEATNVCYRLWTPSASFWIAAPQSRLIFHHSDVVWRGKNTMINWTFHQTPRVHQNDLSPSILSPPCHRRIIDFLILPWPTVLAEAVCSFINVILRHSYFYFYH